MVSRRGTALVKAVFSDGMWGFASSNALATKRVAESILNTPDSKDDDEEEKSLVQLGLGNYSVTSGQAL